MIDRFVIVGDSTDHGEFRIVMVQVTPNQVTEAGNVSSQGSIAGRFGEITIKKIAGGSAGRPGKAAPAAQDRGCLTSGRTVEISSSD